MKYRLPTLALFAIVILTSCKTTQPVVVTEYRDRVYHDTIQQVDTIWQDRFHLEYMKGDTLVLRDSVYLYKYAYKDKVVETYIHDSIPYIQEVQVEKEVVPKFYQRCTAGFFFLLFIILLYIIIRIIIYVKSKQ